MTEEKKQAENETLEALRGIWESLDDKYLQAAVWSYAKGLEDGARIAGQAEVKDRKATA